VALANGSSVSDSSNKGTLPRGANLHLERFAKIGEVILKITQSHGRYLISHFLIAIKRTAVIAFVFDSFEDSSLVWCE